MHGLKSGSCGALEEASAPSDPLAWRGMSRVRGREAEGSCDAAASSPCRVQDGTKVPRKDRFMQRAGVEVRVQFR